VNCPIQTVRGEVCRHGEVIMLVFSECYLTYDNNILVLPLLLKC